VLGKGPQVLELDIEAAGLLRCPPGRLRALDGNKRTSRLLANAVLLAHDYPPVSFFTADETTYKASLVLFYEQGVLGNFRQLVTEQLEYSAERYLPRHSSVASTPRALVRWLQQLPLPETVGKAQEVHLVDGVEHLDGGPADLAPGDLLFTPGSLGTPTNPRHVVVALILEGVAAASADLVQSGDHSGQLLPGNRRCSVTVEAIGPGRGPRSSLEVNPDA
jgi:hypothetical protein